MPSAHSSRRGAMLPGRGVLALAGALLLAGCAGARPPRESGHFRHPELVELVRLEPGLRLDIRYATSNNFLGRPVYREARAFLQRPAAEAAVRAHRALARHGYGLLVHDGYRPWSVTKEFWDRSKPEQRPFVAPPDKGSRHNRGCALDCSLYDLRTGQPVEMPSVYDEPTVRSHSTYAGGPAAARHARDLLRSVLEAEGFVVLPHEWWHFDYQDWQQYRLLDIPFSRIRPTGSPP